ncbi:MAG: hypothetical protein MUC87_18250 [Bacteroidia bacterium]|jgi:hypothetical protein|nr:hypothetical protein [Bacteroidia bacterium]
MQNGYWVSITLALTFFSCNSLYQRNNTSDKQISGNPQYKSESLTQALSYINSGDTIKRLKTDDYPVTEDMINAVRVNNSDRVFFKNDSLQQCLIFDMYTDGHRLAIYHFNSAEIPYQLIEIIELYDEQGNPIPNDKKLPELNRLIKKSFPLPESYFTSHKGLKIGCSKENATTIYGLPDKKLIENATEKYEWAYTGDILYDGKTDLKGKPLALHSYGHKVTMLFKNNTLTGYILHNDIP